jgi:hypothetical protein
MPDGGHAADSRFYSQTGLPDRDKLGGFWLLFLGVPAAREWYAAMLLERGGAGDTDKGRALLEEAVNMYTALRMTFPAKLAREKFAAL